MIRRLPRLAPRWLALALPLLGGEIAAAPGWRARLEPLFEAHCLTCHDADEKNAGEVPIDAWPPSILTGSAYAATAITDAAVRMGITSRVASPFET